MTTQKLIFNEHLNVSGMVARNGLIRKPRNLYQMLEIDPWFSYNISRTQWHTIFLLILATVLGIWAPGGAVKGREKIATALGFNLC